MANYKISGVWTDIQNNITHYAFHEVNSGIISKAAKKSKADAISIVSNIHNHVVTWIWDYKNYGWKDGAKVEVVANSYLRSYHDGILVDNLRHLINYNQVF